MVNGFGFWNKFSGIFKHLTQENSASENVFLTVSLFSVINFSGISQIVIMRKGKEILKCKKISISIVKY